MNQTPAQKSRLPLAFCSFRLSHGCHERAETYPEVLKQLAAAPRTDQCVLIVPKLRWPIHSCTNIFRYIGIKPLCCPKAMICLALHSNCLLIMVCKVFQPMGDNKPDQGIVFSFGCKMKLCLSKALAPTCTCIRPYVIQFEKET